MSRLLLAAGYLTILPVPGRAQRAPHRLGAAAPWFPVVGLLLGVVVVAVDQGAVRLFPPLPAALVALAAWKLLTGGLHLDGLADCLDGALGRDRDHRLAIMRDSRIGTFGALGLIFMLLLGMAAIAETAAGWRWRALLVAPAVGRAAPPLVARLFPAVRPDGQGTAFRAGLRASGAPVATLLALLVAGTVLGIAGVVATAVALAAGIAVGALASARLGGITGDVLGAAVEVAELVTLLVVCAWTAGAR